MQFDAFSYPALNQVISHVAKYRNRSRGRVGMPIVIRIPFGGAIGAAEDHSDSPETYYAHTAGLKVVAPSSALDAYGLLRKAIADPDPVVFLEPKARYWSKEDGELDDDAAAPIGAARIVRPGSDCTVIAYGAMVARALAAAELAAARGAQVEVIDLRSLVPLDQETLAASVRRTGRAVVVHEAPRTLGDRRRGRGAAGGGLLRPSGGADPSRDRARHPVSAGDHRARPRADARAHRGGDRPRGRVLMATRDFLLPDLGEGLEDAEVLQWLVAQGDRVELNQPLVEVNTAKATVEIPRRGRAPSNACTPRRVTSSRSGAPLVSVRVDDGAEAAPTGRRPVLVGYGVDESEESARRVRVPVDRRRRRTDRGGHARGPQAREGTGHRPVDACRLRPRRADHPRGRRARSRNGGAAADSRPPRQATFAPPAAARPTVTWKSFRCRASGGSSPSA